MMRAFLVNVVLSARALEVYYGKMAVVKFSAPRGCGSTSILFGNVVAQVSVIQAVLALLCIITPLVKYH
jgi:hypothetical protein